MMRDFGAALLIATVATALVAPRGRVAPRSKLSAGRTLFDKVRPFSAPQQLPFSPLNVS